MKWMKKDGVVKAREAGKFAVGVSGRDGNGNMLPPLGCFIDDAG